MTRVRLCCGEYSCGWSLLSRLSPGLKCPELVLVPTALDRGGGAARNRAAGGPRVRAWLLIAAVADNRLAGP